MSVLGLVLAMGLLIGLMFDLSELLVKEVDKLNE